MKEVLDFVTWLFEMFAEIRLASGYVGLTKDNELIGRERYKEKVYMTLVIWDVNKKFFAATVEPRLQDFPGVQYGFDKHGRVFISFLGNPLGEMAIIPGWDKFKQQLEEEDNLLRNKYRGHGLDTKGEPWGTIDL